MNIFYLLRILIVVYCSIVLVEAADEVTINKELGVFRANIRDQNQKHIIVFGAGHDHGKYDDNFYLVDTNKDVHPDLIMNVGISKLPKGYSSQFDIVVFEGLCREAYNSDGAFRNAYNLLKDNGVFLSLADDNTEQHEKLLKDFRFFNIQFKVNIEDSIEYKDYVHGDTKRGKYFVAEKNEKERIREDSKIFDKIIQSSLIEKYKSIGLPNDIENFIIKNRCDFFEKNWSVVGFFDLYTNSKYPQNRLGKLCAQIKDVQLEFFYIIEVDMGLYNVNLYDKGYDPKDPIKSPFLLLRRLSYDQNLIVKSRILWEKIMNFIYYLETGKDLEDEKSKKGAFFKFVERKENEKWNFMIPIKDVITKHDDSYRTPEVHKGSTLKKELISPKIDPNNLLKPLNYAQNCIWDNIESIISGKSPKYFFEMHN